MEGTHKYGIGGIKPTRLLNYDPDRGKGREGGEGRSGKEGEGGRRERGSDDTFVLKKKFQIIIVRKVVSKAE